MFTSTRFLLLAGLVTQLAHADTPSSQPATRPSAGPEKRLEQVTIKAIEVKGNFMPGPGPRDTKAKTVLTVQVPSGGCTSAKDFETALQKENDTWILSVYRLKEDKCEAFLPEGTEIQLEANYVSPRDKVTVKNPLLIKDSTTH